MFLMGDIYVDAKTALDSVKSSTWNFFKFRMSGGEVDRILTIINAMMKRLVDVINCNRSAAKSSKVMSSNDIRHRIYKKRAKPFGKG